MLHVSQVQHASSCAITDVPLCARQVAFTVGSIAMTLGSLIAYSLLWAHLGPHGGQLAACLCSSYVGGSINFAAVAKVSEPCGSVIL